MPGMENSEMQVRRQPSTVNCFICGQTYRDRSLPCTHKTCLRCSQIILECEYPPGDQLTPCPICRNEFTSRNNRGIVDGSTGTTYCYQEVSTPDNPNKKFMSTSNEDDDDDDEKEDVVGMTTLYVRDERINVSMTTLQDLPVELLEIIIMKALLKVVLLENLGQSAKDERILEEITELRTVSAEWNYRLTSTWFKIKFQRELQRSGLSSRGLSNKPRYSNYLENPVLFKTISTVGKIPITGMAVLKSELFVVGHESSEVEVYHSTNGSLKRRQEWRDLFHPLDIAASDLHGCLYVLNKVKVEKTEDACQILVVDRNGLSIRKWSTIGKIQRSLSVTDRTPVVVVVVGDDSLTEYSPNGSLIRRIDLQLTSSCNHEPRSIMNPWHAVKLNSCDFVVSHDRSCHVLSVVNADGRLIASSDDALMDPSVYLAVDAEGSIMAVDRENSRVYLLRSLLEDARQPEGCHAAALWPPTCCSVSLPGLRTSTDWRSVRTILSQERHGLRRPSRILLNQSCSRLIVSDETADGCGRVRIFNVRGVK